LTTRKLFLTALLFCFGPTVTADTINVAVASNFAATMKRLVAEFEKSSGHKVRLSFGSSGKFYAQIRHGAPFQLFFSADQETAKALENDQLAVADSCVTYAIGALALWSTAPGFVDPELRRLKSGQFRKLALANPRFAPYGRAALEVLANMQLTEATRRKWVQGENIAQTYQFVHTGNADMGFIARSQLMDNTRDNSGSSWVVPGELHSPIKQDVVLLRRGQSSAAARGLLTFVQSPKAKKIIHSYGYRTPNDPN